MFVQVSALCQCPTDVLNSLLCAPVSGSHGKVLAALLLCNKHPSRPSEPGLEERPEFNALDMSALVMFAQLVAPPLERHLESQGLMR